MTERFQGKVKWFNTEKGYGFIAPEKGGSDVFVHVTSLSQGTHAITEGDTVSFEIGQGRKGDQAKDVKKV